jgi:hypothetical protein
MVLYTDAKPRLIELPNHIFVRSCRTARVHLAPPLVERVVVLVRLAPAPVARASYDVPGMPGLAPGVAPSFCPEDCQAQRVIFITVDTSPLTVARLK